VFELPLATLLEPTAPARRQALRNGRVREYRVWPHHEHEIWGAAAAVLIGLTGRLCEDA
jgi:hypothetical protein